MGFIREPQGVDFFIAPSPSVSEHIACISNYIQKQKRKDSQKDADTESNSGVSAR
jgi:hypothetical protein